MRPALFVPLLFALLNTACTPAPGKALQGYIEGDYVYMASSQPGRLSKLQVQAGQQVAAGAALFALDSDNEAAAVRQAERQLDATRAQLADLQTGKRPQELDVTRAQLAQAQIEEQRSATQLRRDEQQAQAGGIAAAQLDQSRAAAAAASAQVRQLRSSLAVAGLPGRDQQLKAQAAQVAAAQAALDQARWRLTQKSLAAPAAALVNDTLYREGEWVPAGSPVAKLLPPGNIKVRFFVPEPELGRWKLDQAVTLRCDGCQPVSAKVSRINNEAEYTPPVIYSQENRSKLVFMLEARPALADAAKLHPGQPVEVLRND